MMKKEIKKGLHFGLLEDGQHYYRDGGNENSIDGLHFMSNNFIPKKGKEKNPLPLIAHFIFILFILTLAFHGWRIHELKETNDEKNGICSTIAKVQQITR